MLKNSWRIICHCVDERMLAKIKDREKVLLAGKPILYSRSGGPSLKGFEVNKEKHEYLFLMSKLKFCLLSPTSRSETSHSKNRAAKLILFDRRKFKALCREVLVQLTMTTNLKIRFGQARERKQLQWRESFNVFSGVGFRCGSKRGKKNVVSMVSHTFG